MIMKTKLFILVMLLMPILFGCSKESNAIVGDWYICSTEHSDGSAPELYLFKEYTKENTIGFISYTADGKGVLKSIDEVDRSVLKEVNFHWTLSNDKLTITYEGSNKSESETIIFEERDKYYFYTTNGLAYSKISFKRM